MRASANRAAAARGGWRLRTSCGGFFYFISVIIDVIGTCMQNFSEIDRSFFFHFNQASLFSAYPVHEFLEHRKSFPFV